MTADEHAQTGEGATAPQFALHFGGTAPEIIIAGHSHALSMVRAMSAGSLPEIAFAYTANLADGPSLDDAYWEFVARSSANRVVAISWNGNQHHASFLIAPDPGIALWSPARSTVVRGAAGTSILVPRSALRQHWEWSFLQLHTALDMLRACRQVVVLETPPPKRDATVRANLASEVWFAQVADELGIAVADLPLCDEKVRYAMWEVVRDTTTEIADEHGVETIRVPRELLDGDGYLLPEFSAADATHANDEFGDEMVRALLTAVAP